MAWYRGRLRFAEVWSWSRVRVQGSSDGSVNSLCPLAVSSRTTTRCSSPRTMSAIAISAAYLVPPAVWLGPTDRQISTRVHDCGRKFCFATVGRVIGTAARLSDVPPTKHRRRRDRWQVLSAAPPQRNYRTETGCYSARTGTVPLRTSLHSGLDVSSAARPARRRRTCERNSGVLPTKKVDVKLCRRPARARSAGVSCALTSGARGERWTESSIELSSLRPVALDPDEAAYLNLSTNAANWPDVGDYVVAACSKSMSSS